MHHRCLRTAVCEKPVYTSLHTCTRKHYTVVFQLSYVEDYMNILVAVCM